jgi:hypothetical protein
LSASTHGNAEDTIRWLLGLFHRLERQDDEPLLKLASETVNYTISLKPQRNFKSSLRTLLIAS